MTTLAISRRSRSGFSGHVIFDLTVALILLTALPSLNAATLPTGFTETLIANGLSNATAMAFAPDGRLFVCLQQGQLRVITQTGLLPTPFVSLTVNSTGERGLLGVAFDPNFASNQFVYVYYTATSPTIHNRISRFTANGNVALPGSETVILELNDLGATNHNGGAIHFGPDGKLYAAVGENANGSNAQTLNNLLGKMLRLNADGSIPSDNPFFNVAIGNNRMIWALGLRNPFTFDFQPGTGRMFINDVGEVSWEEINDGIRGSTYGWPNAEGNEECTTYRCPIYAYFHSGGACAITGGAFYNPPVQPFPAEYVGKYFFADFCNGRIQRFDPATGTATDFASGIANPVDLRVGSDGNLYYLSRGSGSVWRVQHPNSNTPPTFTLMPTDQTVAVGQTATFSVSTEGAGPITYQWRRNNVNIPGATSSTYTTPPVQASEHGDIFQCVATNPFGSTPSDTASLFVTSNSPPAGTITSPAAGSMYSAGDTITFSGNGTDIQDGTLPATNFTWRVDFHHDTHFHPFMADTSGTKSGTFVIPRTGETSANVWYRIHLTVKDSGNLTHSSFVDIRPRTVTITLQTAPTGFQLTLDGQPVSAPHSFVGVVGMFRTIGAPPTQTRTNGTYDFTSWSDNGAINHQITTPAVNTTYTASYTKRKRNPR